VHHDEEMKDRIKNTDIRGITWGRMSYVFVGAHCSVADRAIPLTAGTCNTSDDSRLLLHRTAMDYDDQFDFARCV
jgi:hypothetical protein